MVHGFPPPAGGKGEFGFILEDNKDITKNLGNLYRV